MLKRLHKIIGLSICLIVIHLSITGAVLMYPSTFKLQDTYFTNSFIYNLYDMYKLSDVKVLEGNDEDIGVLNYHLSSFIPKKQLTRVKFLDSSSKSKLYDTLVYILPS